MSDAAYPGCVCSLCGQHRAIEQRKRNFEAAKIAEDAALGIQNFKPDHYENGGEDIIDRTFRTGTNAEIRGAIKFNIIKYADRLGKKDDEIKELTKIVDYAMRYQNHLLGKMNK